MTPLEDNLIRRITRSGPITIADYMTDCLLHPDHGYYTNRDPFGQAGDFITAPEISQMFGELIGLAIAQARMDRGAPEDAILVELGPGRGTLMRDALRAMAKVPGFAMQPWLIEASPMLRKVQADTLAAYDVHWADSLADLPDGPIFVVANEFFDALPIRQFLRDGTGWRERLVGVSEDHLSFGLSAPTELASLEPYLGQTNDGDLVQISAPSNGFMSDLADRICRQGGAALIIDYGSDSPVGDTLQAIQAHEKRDPLFTPGQSDLTAHVDFGALSLAATAAGAVPSVMIPQGVFLEQLGISVRANQLAQSLPPAQAELLVSQHRRLTHPDEMGNLFKVLGITAPGDSSLPGTAPAAPTNPSQG